MEFVNDRLLNYLIAFNQCNASGATENLDMVIGLFGHYIHTTSSGIGV